MKGFVSKTVSSLPSIGSPGQQRYGSLASCGSPKLSTFARSHLTSDGTKVAPLRRNSLGSQTIQTNFRRNSLGSLGSGLPCEITWLAGAPGAGKGTNSSHVASARGYNAPTIVVSSLLETPECKRIKDAGGMVDDAYVQRALLSELAKPEYRGGVVVDGFPRTEQQAAWLASLHETSAASTKFNFVMLFIEEEASIARQLSRGDAIRKINCVRNATGLEPLEERTTDVCEEAARVRYQNFIAQYDAINKLSGRFPLSIVDASASIDAVRMRLSSSLRSPLYQRNQFVSSLNTSINRKSQMAFM